MYKIQIELYRKTRGKSWDRKEKQWKLNKITRELFKNKVDAYTCLPWRIIWKDMFKISLSLAALISLISISTLQMRCDVRVLAGGDGNGGVFVTPCARERKIFIKIYIKSCEMNPLRKMHCKFLLYICVRFFYFHKICKLENGFERSK